MPVKTIRFAIAALAAAALLPASILWACSKLPGHMTSWQEQRPRAAVFRLWHANPVYADMRLSDAQGQPVPAILTSACVPASVMGDNLIPIYTDVRYISVLEPLQPLEPGRYMIQIGRSRHMFTITDKAAPLVGVRNLRAAATEAETYVSYDSLCRPIYELRRFLELRFRLDAAVPETEEVVFQLRWRPAIERAEQADAAPWQTIQGLLAQRAQDDEWVIRLPTWCFGGLSEAHDQVVLHLSAVGVDGTAGANATAAVDAHAVLFGEAKIEPRECRLPMPIDFKSDVEAFKLVADEATGDLLQLLESPDDPGGVGWDPQRRMTYFQQAVLDPRVQILLQARVAGLETEVTVTLPMTLAQDRLHSPVTREQLAAAIGQLPFDDEEVTEMFITADQSGKLRAWAHTGQMRGYDVNLSR